MADVTYLSCRPTLPVADLGRAIGFYRDVLGLEVRMNAPELGMAVLGRGTAELSLVVTSAVTPQELYLVVEGVDALHAACRGRPMPRSLSTHDWGVRDFTVLDPDGHCVGVGERVPATVTAQ